MEWIWVLIPLAGIAVGIVAILAEHREKMAMIAKGLWPQEKRPQGPSRPEDTLREGIITASVGVALLLAQVLGNLSPWLLVPAFILICVGGALTATVFLRKHV
jgi:hypothetical protein